jgi:hypothetical protein
MLADDELPEIVPVVSNSMIFDYFHTIKYECRDRQ